MGEPQGKYNIKAVSNLLGIHAGTLRAWERRYKMIEPVRNEAGHRLYTDEHIRILKWIVNKVENGFTIGQAVELLHKQDEPAFIEHDPRIANQMDVLKEQLLHELLKFNESKSNELIDRAFSLFSTEKVLIRIMGGILTQVGLKWEKGEILTAHEHFVTSLLRTRIGMVFNSLPVNGFLPKALCVCGPEDQHEIGLLIFTYFLKRRGYETVYLGTGIPAEEVEQIVEEIDAKLVIISSTIPTHRSKAVQLACALKDSGRDLKVGLGGNALNMLSDQEKKRCRDMLVGSTEAEWREWLKE
ncbi:MerR family transcriptional regulator [Alkalicoccus daliensis]|uniref:DNA-binding transcriptional regulator, MerR family n=1 Tax=Alkalicoccus daliensis TaxID=745820 RepID=A0A1H0AX26_9BACI|nr:MerR family transcriptional regulator [Alkalicoccus daliensis]SDN38004.1 DNA-binding transcriptional regulator, MerR family [Alkalicoccus daliensis]